jgi:chemotaxis protein CheD
MLSDPCLIKRPQRNQLDGRYAEDAVQLFLREIFKTKTRKNEYQVKIFGGGNMFANVIKGKQENIGERNIRTGRELLKRYGFHICTEHLGGEGYRRLVFDLWSGDVWMKHTPSFTNVPPENKAIWLKKLKH